MGTVFKDKPLSEITLRKFERPSNEDYEELLRKFCISIGILQPGDSRDVVVDIFKILLKNSKNKKVVTSREIENELKKGRDKGVAASNIRRQLNRLEKIGIIEKIGKGYRIKEFMSLTDLLLDYIKPFIIEPTFERILEYTKKLDEF